jgi:hypothetical protein
MFRASVAARVFTTITGRCRKVAVCFAGSRGGNVGYHRHLPFHCRTMRPLRSLLILLLLCGCATLAGLEYDKRFGPADPTRFDAPPKPQGDLSYRGDVEPILNRRCVVCHGCYDAPCQLELGAWEGVARGASQATVYDAARLLEAPPTRLFVDAQQPSEWRKKDFFAWAPDEAGLLDYNRLENR